MTGAILAGGMSRRMGFNKALIEIEGRAIIERTLALFKETFDEVFIVSNDPLLYAHLEARVTTDIIGGAGSLGGIYTALALSPTDTVFVAACDMPFIDKRAVERVVSFASQKYDVVAPYIGGRLHPMHALYSTRCMASIRGMIDSGDLRVNEAVRRLRLKTLTEADFAGLPIERSVENVNTQEELDRALGRGTGRQT